MENITKKDLMEIVSKSDNEIIKDLAKQKMQDEFEGDIVAQKMIQLSQLISQRTQQGSNIDEDEVKRIVREEIETDKIKFDDLDESLKRMLNRQPTTVTMTIKQGSVTNVVQKQISPAILRPIAQMILSDLLARNNVYLYGGAGTGKTYFAKTLAKFLGWDLIVVSCNQFTSQLELIGGQTIDGYQEGKVVRAFGNLNEDGSPMGRGCVLLLDELPKIDPNTAGILNSVLATIGEYDELGVPEPIQNSKGDKIKRGNCFIMATGNSLLNTKDVEYEANFKQDLSLQDRFVGSTYRLFVDERFEWEFILNKKWAFIFIFLNKLRKTINDEGFTSKAFVSIRLMLSVQKTYNVFRTIKGVSKTKPIVDEPNGEISYTPAPVPLAIYALEPSKTKTVKDSLEEFFGLFTKEQADILKTKTDYDGWLKIVSEKNKLPLDMINTDAELSEIDTILKK
jgi:cobaltochelatase CobS